MNRPPGWLVLATVGMAAVLLGMSVAETSFKGHYLIDQGEFLSIVGLAFILLAGLALHRQDRLAPSLPLVLPWLLYPVITQGDQIIDNLSITAMRWVVHVLLGLIFAMPVAVLVVAARSAVAGRRRVSGAWWTALAPGLRPMARGRVREGTASLAAALLAAEAWLANVYLGTLMIVTLVVLIVGVLLWGSLAGEDGPSPHPAARASRSALVTLLVGVAVSGALYLGFKNRPGAYQGSPAAYMDPADPDGGFALDRVAVPGRPPSPPARPEEVTAALTGYGRALVTLLDGYYILDRNYNYHFHNELFLRSTPLVPGYRQAGLAKAADAARLAADAGRQAGDARAALDADDPLSALLADVTAFVAHSLDRAATLETMSAGFERTTAGLQHATHLYEGEGKLLGDRLAALLDKHHGVLSAAALEPVTGQFLADARAVHARYANRIVGF